MSIAADRHAAEIRAGSRFEFGKNWQHFLKDLTEERIALAERSLAGYLEMPRLDGLRFLDIGSGSGLFSLAARRLGATVTSFDYDPRSVACTAELRRRYFADDPGWTVLQGSVLDRDFLAQLEPADIVYSWGVLHHTGAMQTAFANVMKLVPLGGRLFIAIYNDLGEVTDGWWRVKQRYNRLPKPLKLPYALGVLAGEDVPALYRHLRRRDLAGYLRQWTDYQRLSVRGMSRWHDWIDWVGGFPYERATIEAVVDVFAARGFRLVKLFDRSSGYGCNEFVFRREADDATAIDQQIPGSRLLSRRFGVALSEARIAADGALWGFVRSHAPLPAGARWLVLQDDRLLGEAAPPDAAGAVRIPPEIAALARPDAAQLRLVAGHAEPLAGPFRHQRDHLWQVAAPALAPLADNAPGLNAQHRSPVFLFEDDRQLGVPHAYHQDIAKSGAGRFSHWGDDIYFAPSDNTDPNRNGRRYRLVYPGGVGEHPAS